jgi:hypothetical protein
MNMEEILRHVRRRAGDDNGLLITQQDIADWINSAQMRIATETKILQSVYEHNLPAGDGETDLGVLAFSVERVTCNGQKLTPTTLQKIDTDFPDRDVDASQGTPTQYYIWDNTLYLHPIPDSDVVLRVWENILPSVYSGYTAATTPETPREYHEAIVHFCLARAKEREEDYSSAQMYDQKFESALPGMSSDESDRHDDTYPSVRSIPGDEW